MRHCELRSLLIALIATVIAACGSPGAATAPPPSASASAQAVASPTSSGPAQSCDPACLLMAMQPPALTVPGSLPAGKYTTANFYPGGLTVTLNDQWSSHEDSTGEFALDVAGTNGEGDTIAFWLDMHPVTYDGKPVAGVANTPAAVSDWLHGVRELSVSPAKETTIGVDRLPALVMDIAVSDAAPNGDPGCPTRACAAIFDFPEFSEPWAISGDMKTRLYLAQIGDGPHMLYVVYNVIDASKFAPVAQPVVDSIKLSTVLD
jgi:hypothetical protein